MAEPSPPLELLTTGPTDGLGTFVLAHGAGLSMDAPRMEAIATGLADAGIRIVRFEFPYMRRKRAGAERGAPDSPGVLQSTWRAVIAEVGEPERLVIGGRSMGGRIASMIADAAGVRGLVCLGYPFHPLGRPERTRTDHLAELRTPTLIVQGERDAMGDRADVEGYTLSPAIKVVWLVDGDHSFTPRKRSGVTEAENVATAVAAVCAFMKKLR
ncbi:MAG: dienelactone hydrolase family protein [Chloroflexi bacterium]|nr:dienelactone hydrolase family protein [Chloroflexota bacterium]MDA1147358.1 dienelactone hydrolase family protein [Chloroflexota bacterium]